MNVCLESNIIDVPSKTWWLDTSDTIYVTNSLHEMIIRRKLTNVETKSIYIYIYICKREPQLIKEKKRKKKQH